MDTKEPPNEEKISDPEKLELGSGVYGKIIKKNKNYVTKMTEKFNDKDKTCLCYQNYQEAIFLSTYSHPNIIKAKKIYHKDDFICLDIEKCEMSLHDYAHNVPWKERREEIPYIAYQVLLALSYIHYNNKNHGDLKPCNIMYNRKTKTIKLIDFGGLMSFRHYDHIEPICTYQFAPPEAWLEINDIEPHTDAFDVWSLGAVIIYLISKEFLIDFTEKEKYGPEMVNIMKENEIMPIPKIAEERLTNDLRSILKKMLILDLNMRYSAIELLTLPFFSKMHTTELTESYILKKPECVEYKPLLLTKPYLTTYRTMAIDVIDDLTSSNEISECFALAIYIMDRYTLMTKTPLNKNNYHRIAYGALVIVAAIITETYLYMDWYKPYAENKENYHFEIITTIDMILLTFKYKVYTDTFDWIVWQKTESIDYDVVKTIVRDDYYKFTQSELIDKYDDITKKLT